MSNEIMWEDPPPHREGAPRLSPSFTAAQLRHNPGRWARIASKSSLTAASSAASHINHAHMPTWLPEGAFEATARTVWVKDADGVKRPAHYVYARFMGAVPGE